MDIWLFHFWLKDFAKGAFSISRWKPARGSSMMQASEGCYNAIGRGETVRQLDTCIHYWYLLGCALVDVCAPWG